MIILGINAYHGDAAACMVRDGELIAAGEEGRFRRIKHWVGFPSEAIAWRMADAGITLAGRRSRCRQPRSARQFWTHRNYGLET